MMNDIINYSKNKQQQQISNKMVKNFHQMILMNEILKQQQQVH